MCEQYPITALVEFEVRTANNSVEEWLDVWHERAQDALLGEPETIAYEAAVSQADPSQILIFERYTNGQSSIDAHIKRQAHKSLHETMGSRNMTRRRVMTNLLSDIEDYGRWSRGAGGEPLAEVNVIIVLLVFRFEDAAEKQRYIDVTREHARYCRSAEPDTLIYNGGIAQRDADRGPDIKAGDLVFVAAFKDEAALLKHRDAPRHAKIQPVLEGIERERKFSMNYFSTGKGFLWK